MKNKHIVLTGGTAGIGLEIAKKLCADNKVSVIGRNQKKLNAIKSLSENIWCYQADLADIESVTQAARAIADSNVTVDILINNAAVQYRPSFLDPAFDLSSITTEITTNFTSICHLTHVFLPKLLRAEAGIILNVNSGLGLSPKCSSAVYCGTKGALNIFSQSLRYQLEHTNVKVLQAFMPLVATDMTGGAGAGKLSASYAASKLIKGIEKGTLDHDIGKVALLRLLLRLAPSIAQKIMKAA